MTERFSRLFQLDEDVYSSGSPVLISAGALLKDSVTDSIIVQLKFQNLSTQSIAAAKVKLHAYDIAGNKLQDVDDYQYLDLNVRIGEYWGADKAVILPESGTRSFSVEQIAVLFSGRNTWETVDFTGSAGLPRGVLLEQELSDAGLVAQYRVAVNQNAKYVPTQYGDVWRCSCGAINRGGSCHGCHATKTVVFSSFDAPTLSEKAKERVAKEQEREAEQKKQRQKQARKLKKVAAVSVLLVALVLLFGVWLVPDVIEPNARYSNACTLLESGQFEEAIKIFESLGDYRDAPEQVKAAKYAQAEALEEAGHANEAMVIFQSLGDYEDSSDRIRAIQYAEAVALAGEGQFAKAAAIFNALSNYEDSADQAKAAQYAEATALADEGQYTKAVEIFNALGDYADAEECVTALRSNTFAKFTDNIQVGEHEEAYSVRTASSGIWSLEMLDQAEAIAESRYSELMATGQTEDATRLSEILQLAPERDYSAAKGLLQSGDYDGAYELLGGIPNYKSAANLMSAIENRIDGVYSCDVEYMLVRTTIFLESGDYRYTVSRWYYGPYSKFSQGKLKQTQTSGIEGDLIFEYAADYYRWTVSADKSKIVVEEIAGDYATYKGKVMETTTWTRLDDETAADALRRAQYIGIV